MIDFNKCKINTLKAYGGENNKLAIIYDKNQYMLKFPLLTKYNFNIGKTRCISEHIGSNIYRLFGIESQETLLGTYTHSDTRRFVVACKDFTVGGYTLIDFKALQNQIISENENIDNMELSKIIYIIEHQNVIDPILFKERFWDMFIIDALIGNSDRTNQSFGYIYNEQYNDVQLSPIYNCDSCFYPYLSEKQMEELLSSPKSLESMVMKNPPSAIKINRHRINYYRFINSLENQDCNKAIKRISKKLDLPKIYSFIDNTPYISEIHKEFLKNILRIRKEKIVDSARLKLKSHGGILLSKKE